MIHLESKHLLHGAQPFFRSRPSLSHSKISQNFMETEGTFPCSKELPLVHILSQIKPVHNTAFPPTSVYVFLGVSFLLAFPPKSYMHSSSPHACYMPCQSHSPWLDHFNYILRRLQFVNLLVLQFSPSSYHFILLLPKYSSQHPVLKHPQSILLL
jgi:hypothetical protein